MQKFIKYFLKNKAVTWLLLVLILAGGLFSYTKMGKLEDAPFTIKQALVLTPYPGASPSEVQSQVTDVLEEAIQSLGELYYLKTENRAGLSKITVYVKKEIRADEMQQLWDKLRRKVNDVQGKLPSGAGTSIVNDDFGDVLGVFYGLTGVAIDIMRRNPKVTDARNEWGNMTYMIRPVYDPVKAGFLGITKANLMESVKSIEEGTVIGIYRDEEKKVPVLLKSEKSGIDDPRSLGDFSV